METGVLYYKKFERKVLASDYIDWAFYMIHNGMSNPSLNILVSLTEPLNIFEVEEYFNRALNELAIVEPSYEESARQYVRYLLRQIVADPSIAIDNAYAIYIIAREHCLNEEVIWFEISEMIDDFMYGDNLQNITRTDIDRIIVQESERQLKNKFV